MVKIFFEYTRNQNINVISIACISTHLALGKGERQEWGRAVKTIIEK
jgi:hypothetical protein